jgi:hypothetical protein
MAQGAQRPGPGRADARGARPIPGRQRHLGVLLGQRDRLRHGRAGGDTAADRRRDQPTTTRATAARADDLA